MLLFSYYNMKKKLNRYSHTPSISCVINITILSFDSQIYHSLHADFLKQLYAHAKGYEHSRVDGRNSTCFTVGISLWSVDVSPVNPKKSLNAEWFNACWLWLVYQIDSYTRPVQWLSLIEPWDSSSGLMFILVIFSPCQCSSMLCSLLSSGPSSVHWEHFPSHSTGAKYFSTFVVGLNHWPSLKRRIDFGVTATEHNCTGSALFNFP